jgi:hypothetical protein
MCALAAVKKVPVLEVVRVPVESVVVLAKGCSLDRGCRSFCEVVHYKVPAVCRALRVLVVFGRVVSRANVFVPDFDSEL